MRNFQGIIFICIWIYNEISKSALVYTLMIILKQINRGKISLQIWEISIPKHPKLKLIEKNFKIECETGLRKNQFQQNMLTFWVMINFVLIKLGPMHQLRSSSHYVFLHRVTMFLYYLLFDKTLNGRDFRNVIERPSWNTVRQHSMTN